MPVIDGLSVPVSTRQVPPRRATTGPPEHPVDHHPVIGPPSTPTRRAIGQQPLQPGPFLISQIMAIKHTDDLPDPLQEIHRTRPSPITRAPRATSSSAYRPGPHATS